MNGVLKGMLLVLLIVYVVSPIDLCPGPIDDIILISLSIMWHSANNAIED